MRERLPAPFRDPWSYSVSALRHWWAWLGGIGVAAVLLLLSAVHWQIGQWFYVAIVFAGFSVAQYQTWRDERQRSRTGIEQERAATTDALARLGMARQTIDAFLGGGLATGISPELIHQIASNFGVFKLTGGELALLAFWARTALLGTTLDYQINLVGEGGQAPKVGAQHHELTVEDKALQPKGARIGGVVTSEDRSELNAIKSTHMQLMGRLQAQGVKP
jgi:hypothetical protein